MNERCNALFWLNPLYVKVFKDRSEDEVVCKIVLITFKQNFQLILCDSFK